MRAHTLVIRQRIVAAVERGIPRREVADVFGVSLRSLERYLAKAARGEDLTPGLAPGRRQRLTPEHEAQLLQLMEAEPTATLETQRRHLAEVTGILVSPATLSCVIKRLGLTRRKGQWQLVNATPSPVLPGGQLSRYRSLATRLHR